MIGVVYAILTGAVTKWSSEVNVVQPLTCLLFPYLAYLCAESLGLSGILALVFFVFFYLKNPKNFDII